MENLQNELNREWLDKVLTESLRQWNDFKEERMDCTVEDFVEFTKEIVEMYFLDEIEEDQKMETRYYVCGIGYDENYCVTDYEQSFGDFDTYEEARQLFDELQSQSDGSFFVKAGKIYQLLIQLEECEEDDDESNCIDVKNELWIVNPNLKK